MPALYVKHDDYIGPLVWGNKLRKLEYVFAEAQAQGVETLITCGGVQSNHARTTAQAARRFGFRVILVLNGPRPLKPSGNLLIGYKVGAEIHFVESRHERTGKMLSLAAQEEAGGRKTMVVPLGASDETGALGFVKAMEELSQQEKEMGITFDHIYHATSSAGTQSGMLAGRRIFGIRAAIHGISADDPADEIAGTISRISQEVFDRLGIEVALTGDEILVDDRHVGQGYGIPTAASLEAERLFGEQEGILLDHYYTAKAAAALIQDARSGLFKPTDKLLLWHTGGTISLFK